MLTIQDFDIYGITSLIRDLELVALEWQTVEGEILARRYPLKKQGFKPLFVRTGPIRCEPGDCGLFRILSNEGAYRSIETMWGELVPLATGQVYIGVFCNRFSSRLLCGEVPAEVGGGDHVHLLSQAGGIGRATGYSRTLERINGNGVANCVEWIGGLVDRNHRKVTTKLCNEKARMLANHLEIRRDLVVVAGSGTDVGKTSLTCKLLDDLGSRYKCFAIKGAGTGGFEDLGMYIKHQAWGAVSYPEAGYPSTYLLEKAEYVECMRRMLTLAEHYDQLDIRMLHPSVRSVERIGKPDLILIEQGGDIIEAGIPDFFEERTIGTRLRAVIVAVESAVAAESTVRFLRERIDVGVPIYIGMPLNVNPQAFLHRLRNCIGDKINGIVDGFKPEGWLNLKPHEYAEDANDILSVRDLAKLLTTDLKYDEVLI